MEVSGSQRVKAPRPQVFNALLNPEILKNSVPGCDSGEYVDFPTGRQLKLSISPSIPGLKGPYNVFLQTVDVVALTHVVLIAEPSSSLGSIKAVCTIDLTDDADGTNLNYNAHAEMERKIPATPDMLLKGAIKVAIGQYFNSFKKQRST